MRSFWTSVLVSVMLVSAAQAATLTNIQGRVLLNTGNGFVPVTGTVQVNPGDRIQIVGEGSAQITYENGFVGTVGSNQTVAVLGTPPAPASGLSTPVIIGGVLVVGGVVAAVAAGGGGGSSSGGSSSGPVSP